jgi:hypothetical protein
MLDTMGPLVLWRNTRLSTTALSPHLSVEGFDRPAKKDWQNTSITNFDIRERLRSSHASSQVTQKIIWKNVKEHIDHSQQLSLRSGISYRAITKKRSGRLLP